MFSINSVRAPGRASAFPTLSPRFPTPSISPRANPSDMPPVHASSACASRRNSPSPSLSKPPCSMDCCSKIWAAPATPPKSAACSVRTTASSNAILKPPIGRGCSIRSDTCFATRASEALYGGRSRGSPRSLPKAPQPPANSSGSAATAAPKSPAICSSRSSPRWPSIRSTSTGMETAIPTDSSATKFPDWHAS